MTAKSILVVGGAGGVGFALVTFLVDRGYKVVTTVLNAEEASFVEGRHGRAVPCHIVDLSNAEAAQVKIKDIVSKMDRLDAAAVCAAIAPCGTVELTPLSTFRRSYEINCVSDVAVYQAVMPALRKTQGRIVFIGSLAGRAAYTFMSAYTSTKFALEALCDVMRREAAPQGVKVSLIQPGGIRTNLVRQQLIDVRRDYEALSEEDKARYGYLYLGYLKVAESGLSNPSASAPEQVAAVVLEALEAEEPETRYVAGEDAKEFFKLARNMSDGDIDNLFGQMFSA